MATPNTRIYAFGKADYTPDGHLFGTVYNQNGRKLHDGENEIYGNNFAAGGGLGTGSVTHQHVTFKLEDAKNIVAIGGQEFNTYSKSDGLFSQGASGSLLTNWIPEAKSLLVKSTQAPLTLDFSNAKEGVDLLFDPQIAAKINPEAIAIEQVENVGNGKKKALVSFQDADNNVIGRVEIIAPASFFDPQHPQALIKSIGVASEGGAAGAGIITAKDGVPVLTGSDVLKGQQAIADAEKNGERLESGFVVERSVGSLDKFKEMQGDLAPSDQMFDFKAMFRNKASRAEVLNEVDKAPKTDEAAPTTPPVNDENRRAVIEFIEGISAAKVHDGVMIRPEVEAGIKLLQSKLPEQYKDQLSTLLANNAKPGPMSAEDAAALAGLIKTYKEQPGVTAPTPDNTANLLLGTMTAGGWFVDVNSKQPLQNPALRDDFQVQLLAFEEKRYSERGGVPKLLEQHLRDGVVGTDTTAVFKKMFHDQPEILAAYEKDGPAAFLKGGKYADQFEALAKNAIDKAVPLEHSVEIVHAKTKHHKQADAVARGNNAVDYDVEGNPVPKYEELVAATKPAISGIDVTQVAANAAREGGSVAADANPLGKLMTDEQRAYFAKVGMNHTDLQVKTETGAQKFNLQDAKHDALMAKLNLKVEHTDQIVQGTAGGKVRENGLNVGG